MPLSSQTVIADLPPPEHYTGMDDVLIPHPRYPFKILSEYFPFGVVGKDADGKLELATQVYIESQLFEETTPTHALTDRWIKLHSDDKSQLEFINRGELPTDKAVVPAIVNDKGEVISVPYTFAIETQGANQLSGNPMKDHRVSSRYRQVFTMLPLSANQIFSIRAVRRVHYFESHPMFLEQYKYFFASLRPEAATRQSTLTGSRPLTRRFYTAYANFEIPTPAEYKGNNQWPLDFSAKRSEKWQLPEGELVVSYELQSGYDFLPKHENAKIKSDIKGMVDNLPGYLKSTEPNRPVPEMRYLEVPFGEHALYGSIESDSSEGSIELATAYKKGKVLKINFYGTPALIQQYEPYLLGWVSQIKVMQ